MLLVLAVDGDPSRGLRFQQTFGLRNREPTVPSGSQI